VGISFSSFRGRVGNAYSGGGYWLVGVASLVVIVTYRLGGWLAGCPLRDVVHLERMQIL
jgi:hypothetical protein